MNKFIKLYKASAGSGKTYLIIKNFIILSCKEHFQYILATTFTNQATNQMRMKIISSLYNIIHDENYPLKLDLQKDIPDIQDKAKEILSDILHNYDNLHILTLDSFFQSILKSFINELGIKNAYRLELEPSFAINFMVKDVCQKAMSNDILMNWLCKFSNNKLENGKSWNIVNDLEKISINLFYDNFPIDNHRDIKDIMTLQKEISVKWFEDQMISYAQNIIDIILQNKLTVDDFSYGNKGIMGYIYNIIDKHNFEPSKRVIDGYSDSKSWVTKTHIRQSFIEQLVRNKILPIMNQLISFYNENIKTYNTYQLISQNIYFYGIINELIDSLRKYRTQNNVLLISDVSKLIHEITSDTIVPYIYEKIGNYYHYFLIDEFQDISQYQWDNLYPLIQDSISQGYESIFVGDGKQSIYRWRGSCVDMINSNLQMYFPQQVQVNYLKYNWRSNSNIVEYNNEFFFDSNNKLYDCLNTDDNNDLLKMLKESYSDIKQESTHKKDNNNNVKKISFNNEEGMMNKMIQILNDLHNINYPANEIAILVRTNNEGQKILEYLYGQIGYGIISSSMLKLNNNAAIILIIDILKWYKDKENLLNYSEIKHLIKDKEIPVELSYASLSMKVVNIINKLDLMHNNEIYINAFIDLIFDYENSLSNDNSIESFLSWWSVTEDSHNIVVSSDNNSINIMTIHQSKGLEFDYVILPYYNENVLSNNGNKTIWCKYNGNFYPINYGLKMKNSLFFNEYNEEYISSLYDNLNVLYVANTRAKKRMIMLSCL